MENKEKEEIWAWCPVCYTNTDHVKKDDKWQCKECHLYNPTIRIGKKRKIDEC